jgi:hypothetical protein
MTDGAKIETLGKPPETLMQQVDVMDAPNIQPRRAADPRWGQEYAAFIRLLPELLKTHRGKYVAMHGSKVVAVADTFTDAAMKAYKLVGYVPLHVGLVSEEPVPAVRLPSPRIARSAGHK